MPTPSVTIGVLSDTHGLLRAEAIRALEGSAAIVHAGDVGRPEILDVLGSIAPVTAVRGNTDPPPWPESLPATNELTIGGIWIHVLHVLDDLAVDPKGAGFDVVVHGHSHKPSIERRNGVTYLNPGSCGPRRFRLPVSVARIEIRSGRAECTIVELSGAENR